MFSMQDIGKRIISLRKNKNMTQVDLADKLGISYQAVSSWERGATIPDLDKILKMSQLFGVSTDFLLKDEIEETIPLEEVDGGEESRSISPEEANTYMDLVKAVSGKMAAAISLLILSPISLILLGGMSEYYSMMTEDMAGGIGMVILLVMVAIGVAVLILNGMKLSKYEYLEQEEISLQYGVQGIVEKKREEYEEKYRTNIVIGVVLCILGVIPLMLAAGFKADDFVAVCCVDILLVFVAVAVNFFVRSGMIYGSYEKLLQTGDFTPDKKRVGKKLSYLPGIYWCTATAIYLAISFYTMRWDTSWIIWPVAGVLYAAVYGICGAIAKRKESTF